MTTPSNRGAIFLRVGLSVAGLALLLVVALLFLARGEIGVVEQGELVQLGGNPRPTEPPARLRVVLVDAAELPTDESPADRARALGRWLGLLAPDLVVARGVVLGGRDSELAAPLRVAVEAETPWWAHVTTGASRAAGGAAGGEVLLLLSRLPIDAPVVAMVARMRLSRWGVRAQSASLTATVELGPSRELPIEIGGETATDDDTLDVRWPARPAVSPPSGWTIDGERVLDPTRPPHVPGVVIDLRAVMP